MADSLRRQLERAVRLGDFSVVQALAKIYERGGQGFTIWVLLRDSRYGTSCSVHVTEAGAYREAAKDLFVMLKHDNFDEEATGILRHLLKRRQFKEAVIVYQPLSDGYNLPGLYVIENRLLK